MMDGRLGARLMLSDGKWGRDGNAGRDRGRKSRRPFFVPIEVWQNKGINRQMKKYVNLLQKFDFSALKLSLFKHSPPFPRHLPLSPLLCTKLIYIPWYSTILFKEKGVTSCYTTVRHPVGYNPDLSVRLLHVVRSIFF